MSTSEIANAATAFVTHVWNSPNGVESLDQWLSPDYRDHAYANDRVGLERALIELRAAFPDALFEIEEVVSEGSCAALRMTMRGTHKGRFRNQKATGSAVNVKVVRWLRFERGRIAEHWALLDTASLLRQIKG